LAQQLHTLIVEQLANGVFQLLGRGGLFHGLDAVVRVGPQDRRGQDEHENNSAKGAHHGRLHSSGRRGKSLVAELARVPARPPEVWRLRLRCYFSSKPPTYAPRRPTSFQVSLTPLPL